MSKVKKIFSFFLNDSPSAVGDERSSLCNKPSGGIIGHHRAVPTSDDPMRISLRVTAGPHKGQEFTFMGHDTFFVGRSKLAHFRLPQKDRYFSRLHFLVEVNPPQCRLMDMGSRNGTYVNDQKVTSADLKDGDKIRAGRTILRVGVEAGKEPEVRGQKSEVRNQKSEVSGQEPEVRDQKSEVGGGQVSPGSDARSTFHTLRPFEASGAAASRPAVTPSPAPPVVCLGCGAPMTSTGPAPSEESPRLPEPKRVYLCPACQDRVRTHPQPFAGYQLVRRLGRGGMGVVHLAIRTADENSVALKAILPAVAGTRADVERFLREAAILRQLNHPHIVSFQDMGEAGGQLYFVMDYVPGTDARRLLEERGRLPAGQAVRLICQVLEALEYAHGQKFVHRDIKPANMLITGANGQEMVKLADFGLARTYQASNLSGLTLQGDLGGTLGYMAPEQITNFREARPPADQYSAAATLYTLLTDRLVYDLPRYIHEQILMILQKEPVPIRSRCREIPPELATVIHRALAREPEERFADVKAMRLALQPFA
jgi:serine/threonine-protein kinase